MNLWFFSLKTLRMKGLETLDEEAIIFSNENLIEENKEEEGEDKSEAESSWLRLGFTESEEAVDMVNGKLLG